MLTPDKSFFAGTKLKYDVYDSNGKMNSIILVPPNLNARLNFKYISNATINTALIALRADGANNVFTPVRNISDYKSVASDGTHQVFVDSRNNLYVQESFDSIPK